MEQLRAFTPKSIERITDLAVSFSKITTHRDLSSKKIAILRYEIPKSYLEILKDEDQFHDVLSGEMMVVKTMPVEVRSVLISITDEVYNFYMETKDLLLCSEKFIPVKARIQKIISSTPILTRSELDRINAGDSELLLEKEKRQLYRKKDKTVFLDKNGNFQFFILRYSADGSGDLDLRSVSGNGYQSEFCKSQIGSVPINIPYRKSVMVS